MFPPPVKLTHSLNRAFETSVISQIDLAKVMGVAITLKSKFDFFTGECPLAGCCDLLIVSPRKGIFYCFGCRRAGHAANFVSQFYGMTLSQAVAFLMDPIFQKGPSR